MAITKRAAAQKRQQMAESQARASAALHMIPVSRSTSLELDLDRVLDPAELEVPTG